jgi:hypothetical protein
MRMLVLAIVLLLPGEVEAKPDLCAAAAKNVAPIAALDADPEHPGPAAADIQARIEARCTADHAERSAKAELTCWSAVNNPRDADKCPYKYLDRVATAVVKDYKAAHAK